MTTRYRTVPLRSPAGRELLAGELREGQTYEVDARTGRIAAPRTNRPTRVRKKRKKKWSGG
jgi:hypothetical protein